MSNQSPPSRFVFWCTAPFLIALLVVFPFAVRPEDARGWVVFSTPMSVFVLMLMGFYDGMFGGRFVWCWRGIGGVIFCGFCAYIAALIIDGKWRGDGGRISASAIKTLLSLVVFGLPALWVAVFGELPFYREHYSSTVARIATTGDAYERAFGMQTSILHSTDSNVPHIDLYVFPPSEQRDFIAVVTGGMSELPMDIPDEMDAPAHIELIMGMSDLSNWATNLLKLAAEYPFDHETYLDVHHTIPFGGKLEEGSTLSAFLFVSPRFLPDGLHQFEIDETPIRFLQVVPITTAEHAFARARDQGSKELESLLEKRGYLIVRDVNRPSVV